MDCLSTDGSDKIAAEMGATVVQHGWPGLHAKQFNWALDNLPIKASWVLRLDADEYLYPDAIDEVKSLLPKWDGEKVTYGGLPPDVTSLSPVERRRFAALKDKARLYLAIFPEEVEKTRESVRRGRGWKEECHDFSPTRGFR